MKGLVFITLILFSTFSIAGTDLKGRIDRVWLHPSGDLWLKMDNSAFDEQCEKQWFNFNIKIPKSSPDFPYYYGLILSAQAKNQELFLANFSVFDGTTYCDITKTNYGIVVLSE